MVDRPQPTSEHFLVVSKNKINRIWVMEHADTQPSVLPGISWQCNVRSKFWWFTRSCVSYNVSHFAAFFIVVEAKTSVAESCIILIYVYCYVTYLFEEVVTFTNLASVIMFLNNGLSTNQGWTFEATISQLTNCSSRHQKLVS